jgi:hypothetical protein
MPKSASCLPAAGDAVSAGKQGAIADLPALVRVIPERKHHAPRRCLVGLPSMSIRVFLTAARLFTWSMKARSFGIICRLPG